MKNKVSYGKKKQAKNALLLKVRKQKQQNNLEGFRSVKF